MIISYYGNGKGKTTAALGLALRASGYRKKILVAQFVKGDFKTGEDEALKKIEKLTHKKFGLGFIGIQDDKKSHQDHQEAAQNGLDYLKKNLDQFDLVIIDEIFGAVFAKLISAEEAMDLIRQAVEKNIDVVMTGRPKIDILLEASDLVSEIVEVKHPYQLGKIAKKSIDY